MELVQCVLGQLLTRTVLAYFVLYDNWESTRQQTAERGEQVQTTLQSAMTHWFPNDGNTIALCKISSAACCSATLGIHFVRDVNCVFLSLLPAFCSSLLSIPLHSSPFISDPKMGYGTSSQPSPEHYFFLSHRNLQLKYPNVPL